MKLNPSEISQLIQERIQEFSPSEKWSTEGTIISIEDGIVRLHGLDHVMRRDDRFPL